MADEAAGNKSTPPTGRQTENERLLNPDPSINPIFQKVAGRNLNQGGGIGMIMRNQVLNYYGAVETQDVILTATENRSKQEEEREIVIAIEKAKLAALKANQEKYFKSPTEDRKLEPVDVQSKTKTGGAPLQLREDVRGITPEPPKPAPKVIKKRRLTTDEPPKVEQIEEEKPEPFVSLWEKYADEDPPEVEVEADVTPPPPPRPPYVFSGPKMYNVLLQVTPKDITKVTEGLELLTNASQYKIITPSPKRMMDVSAMVRPRDKTEVKAEDDRALFKNVYTLARPRGYKELNLGTEAIQSEEKMMQASELDIEKSIAASLGIRLSEGNVLWPTVQELNSDLAQIKIKTYIRSFWKLGGDWMFDIRFIQTYTTNYRKTFIYEVVFSKPTNEFPVPPATASVFFIFEAKHYACPDQIMKVQYLLEGNRFPYKPGNTEFREDWLNGIIEDKLRIKNSIHL